MAEFTRAGTGAGIDRPLRARLWLGSLLLALSVGASGCALGGLGNPFAADRISAEEQLAYDTATAPMQSDPRAAEAALAAFLDRYPRSALADDAAEDLAELAFAAGREDEGLRWLGRILSQAPDGDRAAPARLRLATYEYGRDRWSTARRLLEPLDLDRLSPSEQRAALRLRIALAQTPVERLAHQGRLLSALEDALRDRGLDAAARRRLTQRRDLLEEDFGQGLRRAATPELEELLQRRRPEDDRFGRILLELARRALDAGDFSRAEARIERAEPLLVREADRGELALLRSRLGVLEAGAADDAELPPLRALVDRPAPRTRGGRGKIGVVLPLSGRFAAFGEQSLRGLLLAADLFEPRPPAADGGASGNPSPAAARASRSDPEFESDAFDESSQIRLIVRDSAGDPERAAAMVRELESDPGIVAIVGPIFTDESIAAATAAEQAGIPLVALSHREEVPAGRHNVFRTRTTPGDEVSVLVDHAFNELGATRFAVLYPRTRYGRGMRKLYWDAVRARGGKMVAASSYESDATDFSRAIKDMIGYRFISERERRALVEREEELRAARHLPPEEAAKVRAEAYSRPGPDGEPLPPIVDFEVLFIPDSAEKVSLIAPGLAYHEIRGVRLLGTSEWLDPELLTVARRHVSGSVISTPFYPQSDLPFVADFVEAFRETFGEEPDPYAAQAFDAGNLILVQLAAGRDDRDEVRDGLSQTSAFPGATGVLTMRPDGNARRRPFLLGVKGQRFVPLD